VVVVVVVRTVYNILAVRKHHLRLQRTTIKTSQLIPRVYSAVNPIVVQMITLVVAFSPLPCIFLLLSWCWQIHTGGSGRDGVPSVGGGPSARAARHGVGRWPFQSGRGK
jgi:hypothetical protein